MAIAGRDTYDNSVSLKKSVLDKLYYVDPTRCPVFMSSGDLVSKNTVYYHNAIDYTAPSAESAIAESADLSADTQPTETQYTNWTEINAVTYYTSTSMVSSAKNGGQIGTADEMVRMKREAMVTLKNKNEWSIINGTGNAGNNTPTPRRQKGLISLADSGCTANTALSTIGGTAGEVAWRSFLDGLNLVGGMMTGKTVALMAWSTKQSIHAWDGVADSYEGVASAGIIYDNVDVYVGTYGEIALKGHNLYPTTSIVVYDPAKLKKPWLTKTATRKLGIDGLTDKYSVYNELTLRYDTPTTLGRLNLTA